MNWRDQTILDELTLLIIFAAVVAVTLFAVGHALLNKRDPRSALVWVSICLTIPLLGPLFYWLLGINRIRRRALKWHRNSNRPGVPDAEAAVPAETGSQRSYSKELENLEKLGNRVVRNPTRCGNRLMPLVNGEAAYPAMLEAIRAASQTIHLCSYIFDGDGVGAQFVEALAAAARRGVQVRIIVDAMGERYSRLTARNALTGSSVDIRLYLPLHKGPFINLRNHRKLLVVDGRIAFTGGMNIRNNHCLEVTPPHEAAADLHFLVEGPVVHDLQRTFLEDWHFVSGELIDQPFCFPPLVSVGDACIRAIADGPDREFRKLEWIVMGALATARRKVTIMTPYFTPDRPMLTALVTAALRGVEVTLILPAHNNLPFVAWASRASYWELIKNGILIFEQPDPFAHTKLMVVDEIWSLVGSANHDTRSFRLNFELNLSVFDPAFARRIADHCQEALACSREISLQEMDGRPLSVKLRDAAARLFTPYL